MTSIPPAQTKVKEGVDCFNCTRSVRNCDRTKNRCDACAEASEACGGYPREWQWQEGVISRGKNKDWSSSLMTVGDDWQSMTPSNCTFIFKQSTGRPEKRRRKSNSGLNFGANVRIEMLLSLPCQGIAVDDISKSPAGSSESADLKPEQSSAGSYTSMDGQLRAPAYPGSMHTFAVAGWQQNQTVSGIVDEPMVQDSILANVSALEAITEQKFSFGAVSYPPSALYGGCSPRLSASLSQPLENHDMVSLYDVEISAVPLTYDYQANPLRPKSHDAEYLYHAIIATAMHYVSRLRDCDQNKAIEQRAASYRHSATRLCALAQAGATGRVKHAILDTSVILFSLDSFICASGPWKDRLCNVLQILESMGGISGLKSSPRFHGQLVLFVWWDCNIALFTRTATVFPSKYYDYVLRHDKEATSHIFALTGVPKKLFKHMRELCQLANDKEHAEQSFTSFDMERVFKLEKAIRQVSMDDFDAMSVPENPDIINSWYDYAHAASAWKYGLLLYIERVLKWHRASRASGNEITSLARLVLDDVRCCRADSQIRKQLVHPVFLAGAESMDPYSRAFVMQYFSEWMQALGYSMFREAVGLLQETWTQRDLGNEQAWWGDISSTQGGRVEYLLG